jgi:hypothetical protein
MNIKEVLQTIIAMGVVIGMLFGALNYFASAKDLQLVQQRLEQKIVGDAILDIQKRMWQLEDRNHGKELTKWSERDRDEYRKLQIEYKLKTKQMEKMDTK